LNGIDAFDQSGSAVASAGDVNGDGRDDLLIGAVSADQRGRRLAGESYVVFGGLQSFPPHSSSRACSRRTAATAASAS
jgi:hypothetical protein